MPRTPSTTSVVAYLVLVVVPRCMLLTALLSHGQLLWVQVDTGETQMHPQWLAGPFGHVQSNIDHLLSMPGCVDNHHRVLRCLPHASRCCALHIGTHSGGRLSKELLARYEKHTTVAVVATHAPSHGMCAYVDTRATSGKTRGSGNNTLSSMAHRRCPTAG